MSESTAMPMIPLDPTKWVEPEEKFIGRIVECQYTDTDQSKTKEGVTFTEYQNLPRAKRQWKVVVELFDRVYKSSVDGALSPVRRYMTIDLERYDEKKREWVPMAKGNNKAYFTIEKWTAKKLLLHPDPKKWEGAVCEFIYYRSKMFGGGNAAKDIIVPDRLLAMPGVEYEYRGEVTEIEYTPKDDDSVGSLDDSAMAMAAGSAGAGAASKPAAEMLSEDDIRSKLAELGVTETPAEDSDEAAALAKFLKDNKASIPASVKTALVTGDFTF